MPDIRPFKGVLYNPEKVNISEVVTEPYDVISPVQQKSYYALHPNNIVRLILGEQYPADNDKNNCYTRAAEFLNEWLRQDILQRDKKESLYICTQSFLHNGRKKSRTGVIARLKLEAPEENTVLPHENTFSQPVCDRLELTKAVQANLSPIFGLFPDERGELNKLLNKWKKEHRPYFVFEKDKIAYKLWRLEEEKNISAVQRLFKGKQVLIADGHHRYEAALKYKYFMQKRQNKPLSGAAFDYVMTYLAGTSDKGLTILPTHRALKVKGGINSEELIQGLEKNFTVWSFTGREDMFSYLRVKHAARIFGVYLPGGRCYGLKLKNIRTLCAREGIKSLQKDLDVVILHEVIIKKLLAVIPREGDIFYTRDAREAAQLVDDEEYQISFFLCPTTLAQVRRIAQAGERMPHKSTYFYPKVLTGLVLNLLFEDK
ncbi:MAG: DUF1015 domain-containing protein [Candidatus Omnitrophota bacterium]